MNSKPQITLNKIRQSPKMGDKFGASDFLTKAELEELAKTNRRGKKSKRQFDDVDAYGAEIIARFGYDTYQKWNYGKIDPNQMAKWVMAERARERQHWIPLESIIINMVGACIRRHKGEPAPKGPKAAQKILNGDMKAMRGEM